MKKCHIAIATACFLFFASNVYAAVVTFVPRLSVSEEYTDNRDLDAEDEVEEISTIISPGFDQSFTGKSAGLDMSYTAGYVIYHKEDSDDVWRHDGALSFHADLSKHTRLSVRDALLRTDEPLNRDLFDLRDEESPLPEDTAIRRGRYEYFTNAVSVNLEHQFGEKDFINLSYLHSLREELDVDDGNDNRQHSPAIGVSYWFTPQYGLDASAAYTRGIFDNSDDYDDWRGSLSLHHKITKHLNTYLSYDHTIRRIDGDNESDYETYAPSAGISYAVGKDISLSLGGGYFIKNSESGEGDENSFFVDGSINKSWSFPRGSAVLTGSAGLDRNDFGTRNLGYERYYDIAAIANYGLTRNLYTNAAVGYRRNEYIETVDDQKNNEFQISGGLTYTPLRWLFISATYAHNRVQSNIDAEEYDENRITFSISLVPPRGYRHVY